MKYLYNFCLLRVTCYRLHAEGNRQDGNKALCVFVYIATNTFCDTTFIKDDIFIGEIQHGDILAHLVACHAILHGIAYMASMIVMACVHHCSMRCLHIIAKRSESSIKQDEKRGRKEKVMSSHT